MSVNLEDLLFLSSDILTDDSIILNNSDNKADMYFGINTTKNGSILINTDGVKSIDTQIEEEINKSVTNINNIINEYKQVNKNTQLSDQQILDITNNMFDDEFILF